MDELSISSSDDSLFSIEWIQQIMSIIVKLTLITEEWSTLGLFHACLTIVLIIILFHSVLKFLSLLKTKSDKCLKIYNGFDSFMNILPLIIQTVLFDYLCIHIYTSLLIIFVCIYHCAYNPSVMNEDDAYPPLDTNTALGCHSKMYIIYFILTYVSIEFYEWEASTYLYNGPLETLSGDSDGNVRFSFFEQKCEV